MADDIEIKVEESTEPPVCMYCEEGMGEEVFAEWKKENTNYGLFVCEACANLSHFEKNMLWQLGQIKMAIHDVAERIITKEDMQKEKARQNQKTMAGYLDK